MPHHGVVENEVIRKRREQEIQQMNADEGGDDEGQTLPRNVVSWPGGDRGEELFRVTPVDVVRERRVRKERDKLLPC